MAIMLLCLILYTQDILICSLTIHQLM